MSTPSEHTPSKTSVESVLDELIRTSDLNYVTAIPPGEFERLLVEEVENVGAFPRTEHENVKRHIHEHIYDLYGYAMFRLLEKMERHTKDTMELAKLQLEEARKRLENYMRAVAEAKWS